MVDEMRRQLDALMGADRNGDIDIGSFKDDKVCKLFLAGLCPHDLFNNTKRKLPPCNRIHSFPLKDAYEKERASRDFGYEDELERLLRGIVRECDREIEANKRKLEEEEQSKLVDPFERQIKDLEDAQAKAGDEGNVDTFMKLGQMIDELRVKRVQKPAMDLPEGDVGDLLAQHGPNGPQHQQLRVCEICGSFLSSKDDEKRLQDHYIGKLHQGYQICRDKLAELEKRPDRNPNAVEERGGDRVDYHRRDNRGGGYHRDRDYDRGDRGYRGGRDRRDFRDNRDYRDRRDYRDNRDYRDHRDHRDHRDYRDREREYRDYGRGGGYDRDRRSRSPRRRYSRSPSPRSVRQNAPPMPPQHLPPQ